MPVATGFAESFLITWICSIFQRQINSLNFPGHGHDDHCAEDDLTSPKGVGAELKISAVLHASLMPILHVSIIFVALLQQDTIERLCQIKASGSIRAEPQREQSRGFRRWGLCSNYEASASWFHFSNAYFCFLVGKLFKNYWLLAVYGIPVVEHKTWYRWDLILHKMPPAITHPTLQHKEGQQHMSERTHVPRCASVILP